MTARDRAVATIVQAARDLVPAPDGRGAFVLNLIRVDFAVLALARTRRARREVEAGELAAAEVQPLVYVELCEALRPFVDAEVLDRSTAALTAHVATRKAGEHVVARSQMEAAR